MTFSRSRYDTQIKLSPEELFEISQEISLKFAPSITSRSMGSTELSSNFLKPSSPLQPANTPTGPVFHSSQHSRTQISPEELFKISQEISLKFAPNTSAQIPELVLLPVDPFHLYAYWNIGEYSTTTSPKDGQPKPLILRIYWRPDENADVHNTKIWFDVALAENQARKKIRLPIDGTAYSAAIGVLSQDHSLTVYADSNTVHVPCDKIKPPPPARPSRSQYKQPQSATELIILPTPPTLEKSAQPGEKLYYEKNVFNIGNIGISYEKAPDKPSNPEKDRDNERLFFSKMKTMYFEKDINGLPIPKINETSASETFYLEHKNASGQGR
ncbi:MAG: DUF4912 domain-containing protein [Methylovulum sp.]|nr:DUF4912 domain-containing protein [Methylovulum sp.]